jgi:hypothetical protein
LHLANKALKQQNIRISNAKKTLQFEADKDTNADTNTIPNSPLKKPKTSATSSANSPSVGKIVKSLSVTKITKSPSVNKAPLKHNKAARSPSAKSLTKSPSVKSLSKSPSVKSLLKSTSHIKSTPKSTRPKRACTSQNTAATEDKGSESDTTEDKISTPESDTDSEVQFEREEYSFNSDRQEEQLQADALDQQDDEFGDDEFGQNNLDEFGFEPDHPDCLECAQGSGRKHGHTGRHTRTTKEPPFSI